MENVNKNKLYKINQIKYACKDNYTQKNDFSVLFTLPEQFMLN